MTTASGTRARRWPVRVMLVSGLALLGWTLYQQRETVAQAVAHRWDLRLFALAVGCVLGSETLAAARWYVLVRAVAPLPWATVWRLGLAGLAFNSLIPGPNGGDVVKAGLILGGGGPRTLVLSSLVLDRVIGLLGLLVLASAAGASWVTAPADLRPLLVMIWAATGVGAAGLVALFVPGVAGRLCRAAELVPVARGPARQLAVAAAGYRTAWPRLVGNLGLAVVGNTVNVVGIYLVGVMLFPAAPPPADGAFVILPVLMTATVLPAGGLGVAEQIGQRLFGPTGFAGGALVMIGYRVARLGAEAAAAVVFTLLWLRSGPVDSAGGPRPDGPVDNPLPAGPRPE